MDRSIELILLGASVLLLLSVFASKAASKIRVPALLIFLVVGMIAGSEGPGRIEFNNPWLAQMLGVLALVYIIFSGGLHSSLAQVRPVFRSGVTLSTVGVFITAALVGVFASFLFDFSIIGGLLLGAIVSSTDAAVVFSVMSSGRTRLKDHLKQLLEFESGSNDPMAVILTIGFIEMLLVPETSWLWMVFLLLRQLAIGALAGYTMGRAMTFITNRIRLEFEGLYPVLMLTLVLFTYGVTTVIGGSGFLAVYIAGLMLGGSSFVHKHSLTRFHDGLAWLMQIMMFLILGLLVFPSDLVPVMGTALLISLFLIFIARPLSVFISLIPSGLSTKEKGFVSLVGLRGAVPIILATFPVLAGIEGSNAVFNLVFFIVITSVLIQGTTIHFLADWLGVKEPGTDEHKTQLDFELPPQSEREMTEFEIKEGSELGGKQVVELGLPRDSLIMLITRGTGTIVPNGATIIKEGDKLLVLADKKDHYLIDSLLSN